jgi:serine/threonine protein kinase
MLERQGRTKGEAVQGDGRRHATAPIIETRTPAAEQGTHRDTWLFETTPYRLVRFLGMGGTACLYELQHRRLGKRFAGKVLREILADDAQARERMAREGNGLAKVHHPHLVEVTDFTFVADGRPLLVMELLAGTDLRSELARAGRLKLAEAVRWVRQAAQAVGTAHAHGIVHRDLKPENLYLHEFATGERVLKVLDLGLAKMLDTPTAPAPERRYPTERDAFVGTPEYMAPEQLLGQDVDGRADVYGLGVVLYELVAGRRPFEDSPDPGQACLHEAPQPVSRWRRGVPRLLDRVVAKALARDPRQRFQNTDELARWLKRADAELSRQRQRRFIAAATATITGVLTFGLLELLWGMQ